MCRKYGSMVEWARRRRTKTRKSRKRFRRMGRYGHQSLACEECSNDKGLYGRDHSETRLWGAVHRPTCSQPVLKRNGQSSKENLIIRYQE